MDKTGTNKQEKKKETRKRPEGRKNNGVVSVGRKVTPPS